MGRIMKYEIKKSRMIFLIMTVMMLILEAAFLIVNRFSINGSSIIALFLILSAFITYIMVLVNGVMMFSRDMREKSGFMVYMTPVPIWQIILGKILVCFISGAILFAAYVLFGYMDMGCLQKSLAAADSAGAKMFGMMLKNMMTMDAFKTIMRVLISILCSTFALLNAAYLAISLGNTVLRGKKGERAISFVFFVVIMIILQIISFKVAGLGSGDNNIGLVMDKSGLNFSVAADVWREILDNAMSVVFGFAMFGGSSYLIKNKIDL
jgi:ABC-2 type transport system permease protein